METKIELSFSSERVQHQTTPIHTDIIQNDLTDNKKVSDGIFVVVPCDRRFSRVHSQVTSDEGYNFFSSWSLWPECVHHSLKKDH